MVFVTFIGWQKLHKSFFKNYLTFDWKAPSVVRKYAIGNKNYIVKSIFVGDTDIKVAILNLAEKKTIKEMGFANAISYKI